MSYEECSFCKKLFKKNTVNHIYCSNTCRNKQSTNKNRSKEKGKIPVLSYSYNKFEDCDWDWILKNLDNNHLC